MSKDNTTNTEQPTTAAVRSTYGLGGAGATPQLPQPGVIYAGKYKLANYRAEKVGEPAKYWLENGDGEGMEVAEDKIASMLADFFRREF